MVWQGYLLSALLLFSSCTQTDLSSELAAGNCNDDFSRADAASLGRRWEFSGIGNGTRTVALSNQMASIGEPGGGMDYSACRQPVAQGNITVSVKVTPKNDFSASNPKTIALVGRSQSVSSLSDTYICGIEYTATARLTLYKGVNTLRSTLATSATTQTITGGVTYSLSLKMTGSTITCMATSPFIDEISVSDSTFATGYVGVFGFSGTTGISMDYTFDDFKTEVKP